MTLPIADFSPAQRNALCRLIAGPAFLIGTGWASGGALISMSSMQSLISDQMVMVSAPTCDLRRAQANLTPRGRMYARACLERIPDDVPGRAVTPPDAA